MTCASCHDTGSRSKDLHGILDCAMCGAATERVRFASWARDVVREHDPLVSLWLAYQQGKAAAVAGSAA